MNKKIDIYLNRIGQLSQILLVGFAIFGYFYTVRPVYQNASLQESIAKKEIELKDLQSKIDEIYVNLRKELIHKFVVRATYDCSPAMPLMMQAPSDKKTIQEPFSIKLQKVKSLISDNPYNCLIKKAESDTVLINLRNVDKQKLITTVESLKPIITEKYNKMLKQSEDELFLEKLGKKNAINTASLEEFLTNNGIKSPDDSYYKETYILIGMESLISNFSSDFNDTIIDKVKL